MKTLPQRTKPLLFASLLLLGTSSVQAQFAESDVVIHQIAGAGTLGWSVAALEDINSDGIKDFVIGALSASNAIVYSGATAEVLYTLGEPNTDSGYAVADAGDVNNDGKTDILVGAPSGAGTGQVFVYSGADGSLIWTLNGQAAGDRFGSAVASANDANNDGHADILVGAEFCGANGLGDGKAFLYSGKDASLIRQYAAESSNDCFGSGIGSIKDLTGDGIDDHLIGAFAAGPAGLGRVYGYSGADGSQLFTLNPDQNASLFGQFFVSDAGDINGDGTHDIYVGDINHGLNAAGRGYVFSGTDQSVLYRYESSPGRGAGPGRAAGDVNNDGFDDLILASSTVSDTVIGGGLIQIISGQDGTELQRFTGSVGQLQAGFDVDALGDINNDGRTDFLVSAAPLSLVFALAGKTDRPSDFVINPGLNGSWFNPDTSGQGFFIDVFPTIPLVFLAWFTYDTEQPPGSASAVVGNPNHRWLTAAGAFNGNEATLDVTLTTGGLFDDPTNVTNSPAGSYGTITIRFDDCEGGLLTYDFTPSSGLTGSVPMSRIAGSNIPLCEQLAAAATK